MYSHFYYKINDKVIEYINICCFQIHLERVIGLTILSNAGLSCSPTTGTVAYPAGWVSIFSTFLFDCNYQNSWNSQQILWSNLSKIFLQVHNCTLQCKKKPTVTYYKSIPKNFYLARFFRGWTLSCNWRMRPSTSCKSMGCSRQIDDSWVSWAQIWNQLCSK